MTGTTSKGATDLMERSSPGAQAAHLLFRREETAACSEQVVLPDFGKPALLPTGTVVPIEFMPGEPGEHEFTCQTGMLRGRILMEAV